MITIIFRFDQLKVLKLTVKAGILRPFSKIVASPKEPGTNAFVTQTESPVGEEVVCHRFRFRSSTKRRCVVFGCSEVANSEKGISVHVIPYFENNRPVSVRRRKRWVDFVARTRKNWRDSQSSAVCSKHFTAEDFERCLTTDQLPGFERKFLRTLRRDEHGINAFPTIYPQKRKQEDLLGPSSSSSPAKATKPGRGRAHRQVGLIFEL